MPGDVRQGREEGKEMKATDTVGRLWGRMEAGARRRARASRRRLFIDPARIMAEEFCRTLGEDPSRVARIDIVLEAGTPARVEVTKYVSGDEVKRVAGLVEKHVLVPAEEARKLRQREATGAERGHS